MIECKNCRYKGCALCGTDHKIHAATCENYTPATNADRIRAMSDEELAEWFKKHCCPFELSGTDKWECEHDCGKCWLDWLKQETEP